MSNDLLEITNNFTANFLLLRSRVNIFLAQAHSPEKDVHLVWVGVENIYEILQCQFKLENLLMDIHCYSITTPHQQCHNEYSELLNGLLYKHPSSGDITESFIWILDGWSSLHWKQHDMPLWTYLRRITK